MARTKKDVKSPAAKASAKAAKVKASPKPAPQNVGRKRKVEGNPFDGPPDAGQSSILSFSKASRPSDTSDVAPKSPPPKLSSDDSHAPPDDHPPTDVSNAPTLASNTDVPNDAVDGDGLVMEVDHNDIPPAFKDVARGERINLLEIVRQAYMIGWQPRADPDETWQMVVSKFLLSINDNELQSLIEQCKNHRLFNDHVMYVLSTNGLEEENWCFGDPEGDPKEDLDGMIVWLAYEDTEIKPDAVQSGMTDISEHPDPPAVPLNESSMHCEQAGNIWYCKIWLDLMQ